MSKTTFSDNFLRHSPLLFYYAECPDRGCDICLQEGYIFYGNACIPINECLEPEFSAWAHECKNADCVNTYSGYRYDKFVRHIFLLSNVIVNYGNSTILRNSNYPLGSTRMSFHIIRMPPAQTPS